MRGTVLHFDTVSGQGVISGDDGQRYSFSRSELLGGLSYVLAGASVDFTASEGRATQIYAMPNMLSNKNKWIAILLVFFFGIFGVHKFYLGKNNAGIIMLLCGTIGWILFIPGLAICLISFIELIIYLVKSEQEFYNDYVVGDRSWL